MKPSKYEINNALLTEFSPIIETANSIIVPFDFYEEYFVDYFVDNNFHVTIDNSATLKTHLGHIIDLDGSPTSYTLEHLHYVMNEEYFGDKWYDDVKDHTFKTTFIDITECALSIVNAAPMEIAGLDEEIAKLGGSVFVRLNSVSPKEKKPAQNAEEVIQYLTNSSRVADSIKESLKFASPILLMLREYIEDFPYKYEFRCFIYRGKITAISQYHFDQYIEEFQSKDAQQAIIGKISDFYDSIKETIQYSRCTMDVTVTDKVQIVEFGGFGIEQNAGACLYNWHHDYHILYDYTSIDIRVCNDKQYDCGY